MANQNGLPAWQGVLIAIYVVGYFIDIGRTLWAAWPRNSVWSLWDGLYGVLMSAAFWPIKLLMTAF